MNQSKSVFLIEPYYSGSHQLWADGIIENCSKSIKLFTLSGRYWKWRMHGAAITLAEKVNAEISSCALIVCSSMMDVALFKSLLTKQVPIYTYFHESQLTYPWLDQQEDIQEKRNYHYSFINYTSALVSDKVFFNSNYHRQIFTKELPSFLNMYPDHKNLETISLIENKSLVLHLGLDLNFELNDLSQEAPVIIWNHRLEHDKNPELFFNSLFVLKDEGLDFKLIILGEESKNLQSLQNEIKDKLGDRILQWGFVQDRNEYKNWLSKAHIAPISSKQDFFGISLVESCASGLYPIIPKRLAFEEVIPFEEYFYESDLDFINRLRSMIIDKTYQIRQSELIEFVSQYDWKKMGEKYDRELFE